MYFDHDYYLLIVAKLIISNDFMMRLIIGNCFLNSIDASVLAVCHCVSKVIMYLWVPCCSYIIALYIIYPSLSRIDYLICTIRLFYIVFIYQKVMIYNYRNCIYASIFVILWLKIYFNKLCNPSCIVHRCSYLIIW
jgi:hypothetical protein